MGYESAYLFIVFFLDKFDLYGDRLPQSNPSTELKLWMVTIALRWSPLFYHVLIKAGSQAVPVVAGPLRDTVCSAAFDSVAVLALQAMRKHVPH